MLAILQFDAASASLIDKMLSDGRLPTLTALRERGVWHELDAPATRFAAGAQHTLYSGVELGEHGLFYPFQWSAADQRVHYMGDLPAPAPVWQRLGAHGTRTLAVDPYESRPPAQAPPGALVCGWQLHDRVVLQRWSAPDDTHGRLERLFGRPEPVDEVFGRHTVREMLGLRRRLLGAPARVADAAGAPARRAALRPGVADVLRRARGRTPVLGPVAARRRRPRRRTPSACWAAPSSRCTRPWTRPSPGWWPPCPRGPTCWWCRRSAWT